MNGIPAQTHANVNSQAVTSLDPHQPHRLCIRCGYPHPDILLHSCQCTLHARCTPVPIRACPNPHHANLSQGYGLTLELLPMDFTELDDAKRIEGSTKDRARKKARLELDEVDSAPSAQHSERTGRWTLEETTHCDNLILNFMSGRLPLPDGLKLNEFLANMLKSKQSRLTKKMKNAKLSSKTFRRTIGYLDDADARSFSEAEASFFSSIQNPLDRAEIKFHIQKEWRETFSTYCVSYGQALNAAGWLASVEEMDRRNQRLKEMERVRRREKMMGSSSRQDSVQIERGFGMDGSGKAGEENWNRAVVSQDQLSAMNPPIASPDEGSSSANAFQMGAIIHTSSMRDTFVASPELGLPGETQSHSSPFLLRIMSFLQNHNIPFEYIDVWVPSFVPDTEKNDQDSQPKCRLCFAGFMVAQQVVIETAPGLRRSIPLSPEDALNCSSFGEYSESFSFDVGCGLPGRVYQMGVPTWEQSVHNAPANHFERVAGAQQWGIRTVVGIPVPSPNVGRVVVVLYSRYDRPKDHDVVIRLTDEFTALMPSPKWKLVVEIGEQSNGLMSQHQHNGGGKHESVTDGYDDDALIAEVISIFGEHMPSDPSNPGFAYLQGFMSLRLLLLRKTRTNEEQDIVNTILSSYSGYKAGGRIRPDVALMLARDFMFLTQQQAQHVLQPQQVSQQQHMLMNGQMIQAFLPSAQNQYSLSSFTGQMNHAPAPISCDPTPAQQNEDYNGANEPSNLEESAIQPCQSQYITEQTLQQANDANFFLLTDMTPSPLMMGVHSLSTAGMDAVESLLAPENTAS